MNPEIDYETIPPEEIIFPLISCNPITKEWVFIGTGFFIHPLGGFVTAKHNCFKTETINIETLYGVQTTKTGEFHLRPIKYFVTHTTDIVVGFLGKRRLPNEDDEEPEIIPNLVSLDFDILEINDELRTFSYPNSTSKFQKKDNKYELEFNKNWTYGRVVDLHKEGTGKIKGLCYQTTLDLKGGSSGGPVFKGANIVGINSSSFELSEKEEPISFITPISYILDLKVPSTNGGTLDIIDLVKNGNIKSIQYST